MWYRIAVYHQGKLTDLFERPTMSEATADFERAGYRYVVQEPATSLSNTRGRARPRSRKRKPGVVLGCTGTGREN